MPRKKMKLLIVDDEKDICSFVKMLFRQKGFLVRSAISGSQAISVAKKLRPDIVLLDIHLKRGLTGLDVLSKMKETLPLCRYIMVTWDKAQEKMRQAKKLGAAAYLTKPLTTSQLFKVVNRVARGIGRKRGR